LLDTLQLHQVAEKGSRNGAKLFPKGAHKAAMMILQFRDRFFSWEGAKIKQEFDSIKDFPLILYSHTIALICTRIIAQFPI